MTNIFVARATNIFVARRQIYYEELQERDQDILANGLEPEPEGVNDLLVNDEFDPAENQAAFDLGQQLTEATTSVRI